ncbi:MAG: hypothetical protein OXE99_03100 [Cellvibrionales bacterium]|nr:hypothetical protein [Cellvibrionales bacterium]
MKPSTYSISIIILFIVMTTFAGDSTNLQLARLALWALIQNKRKEKDRFFLPTDETEKIAPQNEDESLVIKANHVLVYLSHQAKIGNFFDESMDEKDLIKIKTENVLINTGIIGVSYDTEHNKELFDKIKYLAIYADENQIQEDIVYVNSPKADLSALSSPHTNTFNSNKRNSPPKTCSKVKKHINGKKQTFLITNPFSILKKRNRTKKCDDAKTSTSPLSNTTDSLNFPNEMDLPSKYPPVNRFLSLRRTGPPPSNSNNNRCNSLPRASSSKTKKVSITIEEAIKKLLEQFELKLKSPAPTESEAKTIGRNIKRQLTKQNQPNKNSIEDEELNDFIREYDLIKINSQPNKLF